MFPAEGLELFYMSIYGGFGYDAYCQSDNYLGTATGIVQTANPPYAVSDFLTFSPQFSAAVPTAVIQLFINLATASLPCTGRWEDAWPFAMALFVAHYCTLWGKASQGPPNPTISQVVTQGMAAGIAIAKSVGDVSVSYLPVPGLEEWGEFNMTIYGQQLASRARSVGAGPIYAR